MTALFPSPAEPEHFRLAGRVLFLALALASVALFWVRFGPILERILQSKKDPDFHLAPIGRRIRDFVWEVMLPGQGHSPAPAARPGARPGLLGLLRLCPGHPQPLSSFRSASDFSIPAGVAGAFYFYFAAVFAIACAVGITGLFVRRFLVRPKWLRTAVARNRA